MGYSYFYWMVKLRSLGKVEAICHSKAAAVRPPVCPIKRDRLSIWSWRTAKYEEIYLKKNDSLQDLHSVFYLTTQKVDIKQWASHTLSQVYPNAKGAV